MDTTDSEQTAAAAGQLAVSNSAPVQVSELADHTGIEEETVRFMISREAFTDPDGNVLHYEAKLANGDPLPNWLRFIPKTLAFFGDPRENDAGVYDIVLRAIDSAGEWVEAPFTLTIFGSIEEPIPEPPPPPPPCGLDINGGAGNDRLEGTFCDDRINGGAGNDLLIGGAGNDTLIGGTGRDTLVGGAGDDILQFSIDAVWPACSTLYRAGGGGSVNISGMNRSLDIFDGGQGYDTLLGTSGNDVLRLQDTSAGDGYSGARIVGIEYIDMGAGNDVVDLSSLNLLYGDVTLDGGSGNDVIWSSAGNDFLMGGSGHDWIDGGAGNDLIQGGSGNDTIAGSGAGNDINQGQDGNDTITDLLGNNVLDGGSGADRLQDGNGNSFLAGGTGNDQIYTGRGRDVIAFNRGDGNDVLIGGNETVANDVLSLGGGVQAKDLSLARAGNDLILNLGMNGKNAESMVLKDWYAGNKTIESLQIATKTATGLKVETYSFVGVVAAFDKLKPNQLRNGASWALATPLSQNFLGSSASTMFGGELAAQYALNGNLTGMSLFAAQATLGSAEFGVRAQSLNSFSGIAPQNGLLLA